MIHWRALVASCLGVWLLLLAKSARGNEHEMLLFPTRVSAASEAPSAPLRDQASQLDQILLEAAPDLGLTATLAVSATPSDEALPAEAHTKWVLAPSLHLEKTGVILRLTAVAPGTNVLLVRMQRVNLSRLEVKAVVMLEELVTAGRYGEEVPEAGAETAVEAVNDASSAPPSTGRAILALNTVVYGGYVGFTVQRASGSSDSRLLYPLTALGAGLGLGASFLIADEWNITQGSAWYLSAGLAWPGLAGIALGEAYDGRAEYRHLYGLLGATTGLTLATTTISLTRVTPGHAALAHSGGSFGTLLGGLTEALVLGELSEAPLRGIGWGSAAGVLVAGALAPALETSSTRVLFVDLSASLGALTGAALATPVLLVGDDADEERSRIWFASVMAGTVLGGALGVWMTRQDTQTQTSAVSPTLTQPYVGVLGYTETGKGADPIFGASLSGTW